MNASFLNGPADEEKTPFIQGGFLHPVENAQTVFSAVMNAMARPGTVIETQAAIVPPKPLNPVCAAVLLGLCDSDTPVWMDPEHSGFGAVDAWLSFHTGARLTGEKQDAAFAVIADTEVPFRPGEFANGSQEYPDRSATIIFQVFGFEEQPRWTLQGPGIKESCAFQPVGIADGFIEGWSRNHALFPRGVDVIFTGPAHLAALPRSTRVTAERET